MFVSVRELDLKKVSFEESLAPSVIEWDPGTTQTSALQASGEVSLDEMTEQIRFTGHLTVSLHVECHRCLAPIDIPVDTDFDLAYEPLPEAIPGHEVELHDEDIDLGFYDGEGMELNDVLREQVLLMLPSRALCSPDCKGLCPVCGVNRNEETCACTTKIADERWAALRNL
jgi:uncharacterized protein